MMPAIAPDDSFFEVGPVMVASVWEPAGPVTPPGEYDCTHAPLVSV